MATEMQVESSRHGKGSKELTTPVLAHLPTLSTIKLAYPTAHLLLDFHCYSVQDWPVGFFQVFTDSTKRKKKNFLHFICFYFLFFPLMLVSFSHSGQCRRRKGSIVNSCIYMQDWEETNVHWSHKHTHKERERDERER